MDKRSQIVPPREPVITGYLGEIVLVVVLVVVLMLTGGTCR